MVRTRDLFRVWIVFSLVWIAAVCGWAWKDRQIIFTREAFQSGKEHWPTNSASLKIFTIGAGGQSIPEQTIPSDTRGVPAVRAQDIIDRFGINMHIGTINDGHTVPAYNNVTTSSGFNSIVDNLEYIGVKLIRDWAYTGNTQGVAYWPRIWQALGARYIGVVPGNTSEAAAYQNLAQYRRYSSQNPGMFFAYDGMNEPDVVGQSLWNGQNLQRGINSADGIGVWQAAKADGVKAFCFSSGKMGTLPDQSNYCDYGNAHVYFNPQNQAPDFNGYGAGTLNWVVSMAAKTAPSKRTAVTEWGYATPDQVDRYTQAAYVQHFIMSAAIQKIPYYIYYALYDDAVAASSNYGLFNSDYTPRPAADGLRVLFQLLGDTGPNATSFMPGKLNYSLGGGWDSLVVSGAPNAGGKQLLLQKSDGSFWLMLNNEQNAASGPRVPVTVRLRTMAKSINVYDPLDANRYTPDGPPIPVQTARKTRTISVSLPTHPILIEIFRP